jgi:penicillin-binding protein 1A
MTDLLKAAVQEGTGWRVKALKRPAAGKTGTTNDLRDAWFLGFTPGLVTGVWTGYDDIKPMGRGETGSRAASPIWLYYMSEVLKDRPVEDFAVPEGVVFAKIDSESGFLASSFSKKRRTQKAHAQAQVRPDRAVFPVRYGSLRLKNPPESSKNFLIPFIRI